MKIAMHSLKRQEETGEDWFRGGENIVYARNAYAKPVLFHNL